MKEETKDHPMNENEILIELISNIQSRGTISPYSKQVLDWINSSFIVLRSLPEGNERVNWFCVNILRLLSTEQMQSLKQWINTYETNLEQPDLSNSNNAKDEKQEHHKHSVSHPTIRKTLQMCKDEVAIKSGFFDWLNLEQRFSRSVQEFDKLIAIYYDEAAELYASQFKEDQSTIDKLRKENERLTNNRFKGVMNRIALRGKINTQSVIIKELVEALDSAKRFIYDIGSEANIAPEIDKIESALSKYKSLNVKEGDEVKDFIEVLKEASVEEGFKGTIVAMLAKWDQDLIDLFRKAANIYALQRGDEVKEEQELKPTVSTFEGNVLMIMQEFKEAHDEYSANVSDPVVNPNGENTSYFRGKADAYGYAARQIRAALKWHGKLKD